ncbi:T9SS type A sorting domain-containing protein [Flavobacterium wongokense]|uniref:T9SS type A sorting domain-containing protein n=1 Tax=Flavobacterium wongokense TaxID=2910674 RepID=UPI001F34C855|nr:T9SS type A sorting domain-containing protein [Flavobacterium sp. WG47]MCF6132510.1 T9SS type A sorting domain-containing protein [Flavobacterium sp. WG47]
MRKFIALLLLIGFGVSAQTITRIPGPVDSGLDATDRAMVPIIVKNNFLYCYTTKMIGTVQRYQVVRVNLDTDETFIYNAPGLAGSTYFFARPREFKFYDNDIYFLCGTRLNKIDTLTDTITELAQWCDIVYVFKHYLIYNYNSTNTYVKNLITNTTLELKSGGTSAIGETVGFYEYNDQLYFRSGRRRIDKFLPPNSTTIIYDAPYLASSLTSSRTIVTKVNNNLVYLVIYNGAFKFVSFNLDTNAINTNFAWDTLEQYDTSVSFPFVLNNTIYLTNDNGVYTSDGVSTPVLTTLPFKTFYGTFYNNKIYGTVYGTPYGPELWKTDGTNAGSELVKDINEGSEGMSPIYPLVHNNALFFVATKSNSPSDGWRIYTSDGTEANTLPIVAPNYFTTASGYYSGPLLAYNNYLYFYAVTATESGLYKMDIAAYNLATSDIARPKNTFYPNPTTNSIHTDTDMENIAVYSVRGELVYEVKNTKEANLTSLPTGVYFVKSISTEGMTSIQKIIRQ